MVMVNLGSTDDSQYTGYREITDRDVLDLQCTRKVKVTSCLETTFYHSLKIEIQETRQAEFSDKYLAILLSEKRTF